MNVLALDTATAACSVALLCDGTLRAHRFETMRRGHAEALLPMVETVMAEADLAYAALDLLAVTVGPGTFTGLRVGLAAARGLGLAAGLPIAGVTTLEALAWGVTSATRAGRPLAAVLDARRGELYMQVFDAALAPLTPPLAVAPETAARMVPPGPLLLVGEGADLLAAALGERDGVTVAQTPRLPDAASIAALAARRAAAGVLPSEPPRPLYLRASGARLPGAGAG